MGVWRLELITAQHKSVWARCVTQKPVCIDGQKKDHTQDRHQYGQNQYNTHLKLKNRDSEYPHRLFKLSNKSFNKVALEQVMRGCPAIVHLCLKVATNFRARRARAALWTKTLWKFCYNILSILIEQWSQYYQVSARKPQVDFDKSHMSIYVPDKEAKNEGKKRRKLPKNWIRCIKWYNRSMTAAYHKCSFLFKNAIWRGNSES